MIQTDLFKSIKGASESLYKEKGSKFIGLAIPVSSHNEIKKAIEKAKEDYRDARHHCYAYRLGFPNPEEKANDDGEPGHSAGDPILNQIKSKELSDTLVIVVRYFGGTKLGVSGLKNAYKCAAKEAIENAEEVFKQLSILFKINAPINGMGALEKQVSSLNGNWKKKNFNNSFEGNLEIPLSHRSILEEWISSKAHLGYSCSEL